MFILYISTFPFSFLQAILLNLLLRNYLHFNLYDQVQRNKKTALLHCIIEIFSKKYHFKWSLDWDTCCQNGEWGTEKSEMRQFDATWVIEILYMSFNRVPSLTKLSVIFFCNFPFLFSNNVFLIFPFLNSQNVSIWQLHITLFSFVYVLQCR